MFRILLVDDEQRIIEDLEWHLKTAFPDSHIVSREDVQSALQAVREAADSNEFFDVAILDFKLPLTRGVMTAIDVTVCSEIKKLMRNTVICHITRFKNDAAIVRHIDEEHSGAADPRFLLVPKDLGWMELVVKKLKTYLYSLAVTAHLDEIFGNSLMLAMNRPRSTNRASEGRRSLTHEIAELSSFIANHWCELDENVQQRVQQIFEVDTEAQPIRVSLM